MMRNFFARHPNLIPLLLAAAAAAAVLATAQTPPAGYAIEAVQRAAVARDLIAGTSRGMQALVGSPYLAPLPTILVTLLGLLPFVTVGPHLSGVVGAAGCVLLAVTANAAWRRHGISPALRYPAMLCAMLLPPVVSSVQAGQTDMLLVGLAVAAGVWLAEWGPTGSLQMLAGAAVALALAVGVRYQALLLAAGAAVGVCARVAGARKGWNYIEGTVITFFLPTAYVVLLWLGGNWLILGDPLFCIRAVAGPLALGMTDWRAILTFDCPWELMGLLALLALIVPATCRILLQGRKGLLRQLVAGGTVLGVAILSLAPRLNQPILCSPSGTRQTVWYLESTYPNGTFIVSGYTGYAFMEAAGPAAHERWVHMMRLNPQGVAKVLSDYQGRDVYVLVDAAQVRDRWDEVGLGWQGPGSRIPDRFLFERQVGPWTVFEVLRDEGS